VFGADIDSARAYDRDWHTTFGFGLMERGAHRSLSGRGIVDAHAGDIIAINPGEVHEGWPLGVASRRWRMVCLDPDVVTSITRETGSSGDVRLTRPTIQDRSLMPPLRRLLLRLELWNASPYRPLADAATDCGFADQSHMTRVFVDHFGFTPGAWAASLTRGRGARDRTPTRANTR
jgi:AraC-like DNA-binding protein